MGSALNFLFSGISLGMTFLLGSVGEILTEKSGHLNLGIPGIMCVGGACGCITLQALYPYRAALNPFIIVLLALVGTFLGAALMGLIYCFLAVTLHANQNVTGLALTTFGVGAMEFSMSKVTGLKYLYAVDYFRYPFAHRNDSLKYCGIMVGVAVIIALISSYVLFKTKTGLHLRAVGENPATADAVGINVTRYKYIATLIGSGIAGLGGIFYIMVYSGSQEAYLSIEPFGWLSIALVIFTLWRPHISIIGSIIFGLLFIAGSFVPSLGVTLTMRHTPLLKIIPYAVTIFVLIIIGIRNKKENQPPASLGLSYFREER